MECCFLCQKNPGTSQKRDNFQVISDFCNFTAQVGKFDGGKGESVEDLVTCGQCLERMKCVLRERGKVKEVELRVEKQQLELLKELRILKGCLDKLEVELRTVGEIVKGAEKSSGRSMIGKKVFNGIQDLRRFKHNLGDRLCQNQCPSAKVTTGLEHEADSESEFDVSGEEDEDLLVKYESILQSKDDDMEGMSPLSPKSLAEGQEDDLDSSSDFVVSGDEDEDDMLEKYENILSADQDQEDSPELKPEVKKKSYPCPTCGKVFYNYHTARTHQKTHLSSDSRKKVKCPQCSKRIMTCKMDTHKTWWCKSRPEQPCPHCPKTFKLKWRFYLHLDQAHKDKQGDLHFQCGVCGERFYRKQECYNHEQKHKKVEDREHAPCRLCGRWIDKVNLYSHMSYCKRKRNLICEKCGSSFKNEITLSIHMKNICGNEGGNFSCDLCGKSGFRTERNLRRHKILHGKNAKKENHLCGLCGATFNVRKYLRNHEKICNGTKKPRGPRLDLRVMPVSVGMETSTEVKMNDFTGETSEQNN